jgi:hypothetical protein
MILGHFFKILVITYLHGNTDNESQINPDEGREFQLLK